MEWILSGGIVPWKGLSIAHLGENQMAFYLDQTMYEPAILVTEFLE